MSFYIETGTQVPVRGICPRLREVADLEIQPYEELEQQKREIKEAFIEIANIISMGEIIQEEEKKECMKRELEETKRKLENEKRDRQKEIEEIEESIVIHKSTIKSTIKNMIFIGEIMVLIVLMLS